MDRKSTVGERCRRDDDYPVAVKNVTQYCYMPKKLYFCSDYKNKIEMI